MLEKEEYEQRIKLLEDKLSNLKLNDATREDIDRSLGLLPVNEKSGRKIAMTFDDRVKSFETDIESKNKEAEHFVHKMQEDRKKREMKRKHEQKKMLEKVLKEQEQFKQKQKEREHKKKLERKKQYEQLKHQLEEREMQRKKLQEEWKKQDKTLFKANRNSNKTRYEEEVLLPQLEKVRLF